VNDFDFKIREKKIEDNDWVKSVATEQWGSEKIISREKMHHVLTLPGFIAEKEGKQVGVILYFIENDECEIVSLYSSIEKNGIGTELMKKVIEESKKGNCKRVWVLTTNDNTYALKFYQKRGFVLFAVRINKIEEQRLKKPIPQTGNDGIPIRDEIELEIFV